MTWSKRKPQEADETQELTDAQVAGPKAASGSLDSSIEGVHTTEGVDDTGPPAQSRGGTASGTSGPRVEAGDRSTLPALPEAVKDAAEAIDGTDLTDEEARTLAAELAEKVKVEADVTPKTPEQLASEAASHQVFECPRGHQQHGPMEVVATSKHTQQIIARSGPTCTACQVIDIGVRYPTYPVLENQNRAERRAYARMKKKRKAKKAGRR